MAKTWPRLHQNKALVVCFIMVLAVFSGGMGNHWQGSQAPHGFLQGPSRICWKPQVNAFTAAYDGSDPDASALLVGLSGMIDADDPRFLGTIDLVERYLRTGPTVYRYHYDDGLPGVEGGFHLCTSWLIDALVYVGRIKEAEQLFKDLIALAGPTGLLSEEYDPHSGLALGNFPQAYSHLGIIENALNLDAALRHTATDQ
jgi:trehalose 6-phosphate phosphatase